MNLTVTKTSIMISGITNSESINTIITAANKTGCNALFLGNTASAITGSSLGLFIEELEATSTEVVQERVLLRRGQSIYA